MKKDIKSKDNLKKIKEEISKYKNSYLRALADYQNFEKRVADEKEDIIKNASKKLILKILPVLDNIEKAQIFIKDEGLNMIRQHFIKILIDEGLEEINIKDQIYNPEFAEVVSVVDGENDGKIIEVLRKGYKLNGKIIRPAQVKVEKKVVVNKITP